MPSLRWMLLLLVCFHLPLRAETVLEDWHAWIDQHAEQGFEQAVEWRRHFHANPELSNREFETAATIAEALRGMGIEVTTGVAHTGVVGVLVGGKPGPVVGLRADIDALPVPSRVGLPFSPDVT